jgi:hypothetical protein
MSQQHVSVLDAPEVRAALQQAWEDSQPGLSGGHEEGGFVVRDAEGCLSVVRWPKGAQNRIEMPPHANCRIGECDVVATFHTHPNPGSDYLQEPGETDKRAVRDDPDLKGAFYAGELVISRASIYLIAPDGRVSELGETHSLLTKR